MRFASRVAALDLERLFPERHSVRESRDGTIVRKGISLWDGWSDEIYQRATVSAFVGLWWKIGDVKMSGG